ncbi:uncharacterized protein LAESUDRAFT_751894 [Laetiporus sulphureus 93-53]|uniref:Uncharacterized protein n=1 Tax=Laetiporus sulphureus 93-53 TaxID=1314785 RepID=A0A165CGP5_9APHY|nr:uncharacterized protein LAESUDRAFT_751894 [Laetiporus sulphureus 93-53]KZT02774.1 hypothetical protein LAESUDRAFT_751894 [Laetiporus sulphureus 93-53]
MSTSNELSGASTLSASLQPNAPENNGEKLMPDPEENISAHLHGGLELSNVLVPQGFFESAYFPAIDVPTGNTGDGGSHQELYVSAEEGSSFLDASLGIESGHAESDSLGYSEPVNWPLSNVHETNANYWDRIYEGMRSQFMEDEKYRYHSPVSQSQRWATPLREEAFSLLEPDDGTLVPYKDPYLEEEDGDIWLPVTVSAPLSLKPIPRTPKRRTKGKSPVKKKAKTPRTPKTHMSRSTLPKASPKKRASDNVAGLNTPPTTPARRSARLDEKKKKVVEEQVDELLLKPGQQDV